MLYKIGDSNECRNYWIINYIFIRSICFNRGDGCILANKKQKIIDFSLGLAFSVIVMLIILDLIPEVIEHLGLRYIWLFLYLLI